MPAPKKYPDELRERATRLVVEARRDPADKAEVTTDPGRGGLDAAARWRWHPC